MGNTKFEDLEYKVSFADGLRPNVFVYGVDAVKEEIYCARGFIAVKIGAGYDIESVVGTEKKNIFLQVMPSCGFATVRETFTQAIPHKKGWEKELCSLLESDGFDVIKVYSPQELDPVLHLHGLAYFETFYGLAKKCVTQFEQFVRKNPQHQPIPWKKK